jgi:hypothetical protein
VKTTRWVPRANPLLQTRSSHCCECSTSRTQNLKAHAVHMTVGDNKNQFHAKYPVPLQSVIRPERYKVVPMHFLVRFLEAPTMCGPGGKPLLATARSLAQISRDWLMGETKRRDLVRLRRETAWSIGLRSLLFFQANNGILASLFGNVREMVSTVLYDWLILESTGCGFIKTFFFFVVNIILWIC